MNQDEALAGWRKDAADHARRTMDPGKNWISPEYYTVHGGWVWVPIDQNAHRVTIRHGKFIDYVTNSDITHRLSPKQQRKIEALLA